MSSTMTIVIAVVVVLAVIVLVALVAVGMRSRRSQRLRDRFGPEYDRAVEETGNRQQAEQQLQERMRRRDALQIRDLEPAARERYVEEWHAVQTRFVDDPRGAVAAADQLVTRLMRDRGYPAESFEQQVADVSVDHPAGAEAYRRGREVLANARGDVATDDLRQAMVRYRELFGELTGDPGLAPGAPVEPGPAGEGAGEPAARREVT